MTGFGTKKDAYAGSRHRALARALAGRLYVADSGRLQLVRGAPEFARLFDTLASRHGVPAGGDMPTPVQLGFAAHNVEELSSWGLTTRSRALARWRKLLEHEMGRARMTAARRRRIRSWQREIDDLTGQLACIHDWQRERRNALGGTSPYLLRPAAQGALDEFTAGLPAGKVLAPYARWLAHLVTWLSGPASLQRYLHVIRPLLAGLDDVADVAKLRKFQRQLHQFKKRFLAAACSARGAVSFELREAIKQLPEHLTRRAGLSLRRRGRTPVAHCELLLERSQSLLREYSTLVTIGIPAGMAAVAVCDPSHVPLPQTMVTEHRTENDWHEFRYFVGALHEQSSKRGYDLLLENLAEVTELPDTSHLDTMRRLLAKGATHEDIAWMLREYVVDCFGNKDIVPTAVRQLATALAERGAELAYDDLVDLCTAIKTPRDVRLVRRLHAWLRQLPKSAMPPRRAADVRRAVADVVVPAAFHPRACQRVLRWTTPPRHLRIAPPCPVPISHEMQRWLRQLGHYQQLAGARPSLPKSLRKPLEAAQREARELAYLRQRVSSTSADAKLRARLALLERRMDKPRPAASARLLRAAQEVCTIQALAALRKMLCEEAMQRWHEAAGQPPPSLSTARLMEFCRWFAAMDHERLETLRAILQAWQQLGAGYKAALDKNQAWLSAAQDKGVDLAAWLQPEPAIMPDDRCQTFTLAIAQDPLDTFLMGTFFDTCLNLRSGCYRMSVLANAYDANKSVLQLRDRHGKVVGRKLMTLSEQFELLGYVTYLSVDGSDQATRAAIDEAVDSYCGRWARRCGVALADDGQPERLGSDFWWDDGPCSWSQAARNAWQRPSPAASNADRRSAELTYAVA